MRFFNSPRRVMIAASCAAALVTLLVSVLPFTHLAYRSPGAHVAIETAASLIALLAAIIVMGRFGRSHQRSDLMLSAALMLLAATNLLFSALPSLSQGAVGTFDIWTPVAGRTLAAAALLAAAFLPDRRVRRPRRALVRAAALVAGAMALIAGATALLGSSLPSGIDASLSPESSGRPRIVGPPALLGIYILIMVMYAVAAVGFMRRAEKTRDALMTAFAAGAAIAAFSRLNYFLFPSIYSEWVYTGDFLRLAFYLVLLVGAAREIAAYQVQLASAAAWEERRRMARNLHDGLAQELAFIASQSHRLRDGSRADVAELVGQAADRALDESRTLITTFTRPPEERLCEAITETVRELAARGGADVSLDLDDEATATPAVRESLVRIAGEAVNNAVRHGARQLWVSLDQEDKLRLIIRDDGPGFDVEKTGPGGFGLRSMRERAESLGGELTIASGHGNGATIEVCVP